MRSAKLAEAIIIQAMDDLYEKKEREASLEFFTGEGFAQCAALAGMDHEEMIRVLEVVSALVGCTTRPAFREICVSGDSGLLLLHMRTRAQGTV